MLTIVTPVLNGALFIKKNIESIMTLKIPFEHIIVDGGSTDGTLEILKQYKHLIIINQNGNEGMYQAINQGFAIGKGEYLAYINADDFIFNNGFELMYKEISEKKMDLVYSASIELYVNINKEEYVKGNRFGRFFLINGILPFVQPSAIYSKKIFNQVNGFNFKAFKIMGDLDFFMKIAEIPDSKIKRINKLSTVFLKHGNSLGDLNNELYFTEKNYRKIRSNIYIKILYKITKIF